jgi:DNA-directed RNA polymerase specialized sigma24 family protein
MSGERGSTLVDTSDETTFRRFVPMVEPRLRTALVGVYGPDRGAEATAEALAYAWEHWDQVKGLSNPAGYLYRVGQSRTRPRKIRSLFHRPEVPEQWVEPALGAALGKLAQGQRAAVVLVFVAGFTTKEAAEMLGTSVSAVKTNTKRGLDNLRRSLGVTVNDA